MVQINVEVPHDSVCSQPCLFEGSAPSIAVFVIVELTLLGRKITAVGLQITFLIGNKIWLCDIHELLLILNWSVFGNLWILMVSCFDGGFFSAVCVHESMPHFIFVICFVVSVSRSAWLYYTVLPFLVPRLFANAVLMMQTRFFMLMKIILT